MNFDIFDGWGRIVFFGLIATAFLAPALKITCLVMGLNAHCE